MKNLVSTTARAVGDREKVERPWRVHLVVGEEIQWRISLQVSQCTPPFSEMLYVLIYNYSVTA
jgi:hypothetical protein